MHPEEFLINQFADSLSYPQMFLEKKLPALGKKPEVGPNELRILERLSGLTSEYNIISKIG